MATNRSNEPVRPIEIEIQAKDSATKVLKDTSVAFAQLKDESAAVSKSLALAGSSLVTVAAFADTARLKVLDASTAMAGLGVATVTTVGLITSKITGLFSLVGEIKKTVQENPIANNFFSMIGQQAEEAISQTASLSDNIRAIGNIAVPVGEGFAREILKLDTKPISKKISESVSQGVRGITGAVFNPIEEALGFSVFSGTQRAIGEALQSLDKSLAKDAISSFFDFTLGVGPVRALVEDIATSPAIAQYSPKFIQSLLSGSASAAVDDLTGSIAGLVASQVSGNSPLASLLIGTGFNNQIQSLASTEVQTIFQGLNSQLANFTLENRIIDIIGNNTSASFVKGILKQPLVTNILNPTIQALATGNFTEAIASALETSLSKTINDAFQLANRRVAQLSTTAGRATLSRILDGGADAKARARLQEIKDNFQQEKDILDARKALIENNFQLNERILNNRISQNQSRIQNPVIDDAERLGLEKNIRTLTSQLSRLRNEQSRELAKLQSEYNIYESRVRASSGEIADLEKFLARNNRTQAIVGNTFDGVGERFLKGFGFGSKISLTNKILPLIFDLSTGGASGALSGIIGNQLTDALDKIFPEVNDSISGFVREITRIGVVDNAIGAAIASTGGRALDKLIPRLISPIINNSIDGLEQLGGRLIADRLSKFFPPIIQTAIADGIQSTGISKVIFTKIFENLNPQILKANLTSLSDNLGVFSNNIVSGLSKIEVFTIKALYGIQRALVFTVNSVSYIQDGISRFVSGTNTFLDTLSNKIVGFYGSIVNATNQGAASATNLLDKATQLLERLKSGDTTGTKVAIIESVQNGIAKATQAVGFLQAKILDLADSGLDLSFGGIENFRDFINNANIFDLISGGINSLNFLITKTFSLAVSGIENIKKISPQVIDILIGGVSKTQGAIGSVFEKIAAGIDKTITSNKLGSGINDFLSSAKDKISDFAAALKQQQQNTTDSADETKKNFLDMATNIQKSLTDASGYITKFADKIKESLNKAKDDAANGQGIGNGILAQIIKVYNGIGKAISKIVGDGLFDPTAIQEKIKNIQDAIKEAIPTIEEFQKALSEKAQEIRENLNKFFGDSAERFGNFIGNLFDEDTTDETAIKFRTLLSPFQDIFNNIFSLTARQGQRSFLAGILGEGFDRIAPALDLIDRSIVNVYRSISSVASQTSQALDIFSLIPGKFAGFNEPLAVFGYFEQTVGSVASGVSFLSEKLSFFTQGLSSLQQLTQNGPFKLLIGQTVELREQLLATQASLVGTSAIFNKFTGQEIKDPTAAIKSLDLPILSQIEKLRTESLELVGVTSKDLVPLFQQVASRITSIGGSLTDAKNLSLDFAASLGTLNIPLAQSQQEISSILTGQIDQNSALAKSLNITNEQVNLYKSQGRLVEELRKRLEAFRAGNKLAAQSLGGITSNIQEIFDEIGRKAGQPLLDPLLKQADAVYQFISNNQQQLIAYFGQFSTYMLRIGTAIGDAIKTVGKSFQGLIVQAPIYLFKSLTNTVEAFNGAIQFAAQALAPIVNTLSAMLSVAGGLGGPMLGLFLTTKVLSGAVSTLGDMFGVVTQLIPGLGELLFFLDVRSGGVIDQFANLSKILGVGASGFLVLGKNLESIPGAMGVINQALGPVGGLVAGFIPTLSGVGIQLAGLVAIFPVLGSVLSNFITQAPAMARAIATLASASIYTAPLAPLFTEAAKGLDLYADASTRQAVIGGQLTQVLRSLGKAVASNILTLGFLAAGTYAAFLAFDAFVLKNETVRQILSAVGDGLKTLGGIIADVFGNEMTRGIAIATALSAIISLGLIPSVRTLIALQLGTWAEAAAGGITALSKAVGLLGLTNLAASLASSSLGFQALSIFMQQGAVASAQFLATNGILVKTLSFLPVPLASATTGVATFATALWAAILPMLPVIATIGLVVAAIAGIGLAVQKQKLAAGTAEVEEYGRQMENASDQSLKLAQNLKRAGDAQAEANKRGVQLTKEQYAENAKLLRQTELQRARLDDEIKNRQEALKDISGEENKAALQAQIDDLKKQQEILTRLSSDTIQTKPKEILDKGSAFEQLRIKIEGAKAAIEKPSDDAALKQKSQELIEITQQQLELGAITSEEARKNLELVSSNAKLEQDVRIKAQKAIIESYKDTSRIEALKAEFDLINAQLAAGQLTFAENAKAIANIQNSALEDRMRNEESAHEETMKRLQSEYEGKKILLEQDLLSARLAAAQNIGTELGNQQLARAEEISKQLQQLEVSSNQERQNETKRNGEVTAAITQQIAENQAKQLKLAKELEKQVRDGSISEEQAALRQSSEAKKAELDAQLKASENAYRKQREIINQQFQQDKETAEKERRASIEAAAKAVPGSKEFQSSIQNAEAANSKIENSRKAATQALLKADRDYLAEKSKLETQSLQVEADNEKKQREAAIKFFDTKQKQAQDVLQQSQNKQLINIQKLENAGLVIKEQTELSKTKATGERINNDLRQEQEKLKKLESLEKPKNQQERLSLETQIRASKLKTQDLIREGLENEQKGYDGQINLVKANIKLDGEAKETILEKQRLTLGEAAIAQRLARQKVTDLEKELALETKNKQRRSAIILELEKARTAVRNASIAEELNDFDNTSTQLQTGLENRYNKGQEFRSRIRVAEAQEAVKRAQKEFDLEKNNVDKKYKLELALEKAKTALREAQVASELDIFDNTTAKLQAGLESRYRNGQVLQSRVKVLEAQEAVKRAQKEFDLEKNNLDKKYKLQLALEKAKTALLDAQIAERKELIETENQEYLNQIEEQNQAIKKQSMLYEVLASALAERNKVLEASKNLAAAAAGYITTELDVLSKVETSEYRRKQLAEISAAIKLEALRKQQEFERQSLENQILQNKLALEREVIQNRINQSTKIAEIAKQQADIEAFKADSRNNSRSGRAQLRAKELALEANQFGLVQLSLQGGLIQQQLGNQDTLANFQRRSLELKQKGEERQAQAELVNALPAGRKQRAARALKQQTLQDLGASSFQEFRDAGLAKSRGIIKKDLGITPSIDLLGAVDPELAGLLENLSPSQQAAAIGGVGRTFNKEYGGTQSLSNVSSPNPTGKPLQLLPEFQGRLTLPSPNQRGSSIVSLEKSGNLFQTGVEKLINYLDDQKKTTKGTNYQITINSPSGSASTSGTGKTSSLEETLRVAKQLAGIR